MGHIKMSTIFIMQAGDQVHKFQRCITLHLRYGNHPLLPFRRQQNVQRHRCQHQPPSVFQAWLLQDVVKRAVIWMIAEKSKVKYQDVEVIFSRYYLIEEKFRKVNLAVFIPDEIMSVKVQEYR